MGLHLRLATLDDAPAVERLNARLRAGGVDTPVYPPEPVSPVVEGEPHESYYVVADGDEIRGSVYLRRSRLWIGERVLPIGWIKYPVAESLVDKRFAGVPAAMIMHLQRELPHLLVVGMGGPQGQFAKLLSALRWSGGVVPTYVLPADPVAVVRELPHLAGRTGLRRAAALLHGTGAGFVARAALRAWRGWRGRSALRTATVIAHPAPDEQWTAVFHAARAAYPAIADRTVRSVAWAVPPAAPGVRYWTVKRDGGIAGWVAAQMLDFARARHRPYGALRVGIVHDMLARPDAAPTVVAAAVRALVSEGAQLLIANHSAASWRPAFLTAGFLDAPPSFACMASPALTAVLGESGLTPDHVYITRGDDGVMNPESAS